MHVHLSESEYENAKLLIESFGYVDYDKKDIVINDTISYHAYVNLFDAECILPTLEKTIVNKQLTVKYDELYKLYHKFAMVWIINQNINETGIEYLHKKFAIVDNVLFRMGVTDINTLYLIMYGIRKLTLNEY